MRTTKKKTSRVALATGALTLMAGGIAFAYWTAGGSGTGTATTAADSEAVTVTQTGTLLPMGPGVAPQTLSGTFTNPNGDPVYVSTVTVSIGVVDDGGGVLRGRLRAHG